MDKIIEFFENIKIGTFSLAMLVSAILVFLVCIIVIRLFSKLFKRALSKSKIDDALKNFLASIVKVVLWIIAILIIVDLLGIPTASFVAILSVIGLALSLSVQNIVSNLFSGLTLLFTKPFAAGDYVVINTQEGTICSVGLFYTVIENADKVMISIPNGDVTAAAIQNFSVSPARRVDRPFNVSSEASTEKVEKALLVAASRVSNVHDHPNPRVVIKGFGEGFVTYAIRVWCAAEDYWEVFYSINENVRAELLAQEIPMIYNQVSVDIKKTQGE